MKAVRGPGALTWWALLLITLATGVARFHGLDHGLPHVMEQDNEIQSQVRHLRDGSWGAQIQREYASYPLLIAYLTTAWSERIEPPPTSEQGTAEEHRRAAGGTTFQVRQTVAALSVWVVPLTFLLALRFVGPGWALFAAALAATSLLNQFMAQQARAHSVQTVFAVATVLACVRLIDRPSLARHLAAGSCFGLALGSLNNGIALGFAVLGAHLVARRREPGVPLKRGLAALATGGLALPVFYPFLFEDWALRREQEDFMVGTHDLRPEMVDGTGLGPVLWTLWSYEPVLLVLAGLAAVVAAHGALRGGLRIGPKARVVLWYALPYLAVLVLFGRTRDRFVLPLQPLLAILAAWGLARWSARLGLPRAAWAAVAALALAIPALATARVSWLRGQPDTLEEAARWVRAHAGERPIFMAPRPSWLYSESSMELPLGRTREALRGPGGSRLTDYNLWSRYQRRLGDRQGPPPRFELRWAWWSQRDVEDFQPPRSEFLAANPRSYFASTGPGIYLVESYADRDAEEIKGLRQALETCGDLRAVFSPDRDPASTALPMMYRDGWADPPHVTLRVLGARAWGPRVEVYRLGPRLLWSPDRS